MGNLIYNDLIDNLLNIGAINCANYIMIIIYSNYITFLFVKTIYNYINKYLFEIHLINIRKII
jgi:hypothetical protein